MSLYEILARTWAALVGALSLPARKIEERLMATIAEVRAELDKVEASVAALEARVAAQVPAATPADLDEVVARVAAVSAKVDAVAP